MEPAMAQHDNDVVMASGPAEFLDCPRFIGNIFFGCVVKWSNELSSEDLTLVTPLFCRPLCYP